MYTPLVSPIPVVTETHSHNVDLQPQFPQIAEPSCLDVDPQDVQIQAENDSQPESAQLSQVAESHSQNIDPQPETENQVHETTTITSQYVDASPHPSPNDEVPELPGEIVVGPPPCPQNDDAPEITQESTAPTRTDSDLSSLEKARRKKAAILGKKKGAMAQRAARLNKGKTEGSQTSRTCISQPFSAQVFTGQLSFNAINSQQCPSSDIHLPDNWEAEMLALAHRLNYEANKYSTVGENDTLG
jgi:hypothetical protein